MKISELATILEKIAPPQYQEAYDNSGLIVGNSTADITGILICLDSTEAVIDEAINLGCNLVVAHHPIVFKGLKKFNGRNYVERTVIKAIKNDIAIYAIHTNLDNMLYNGVNTQICHKLGIKNAKILAPKPQTLKQLTAFTPLDATQKVLDALYEAGAGEIGKYKNCSFTSLGTGSFTPTHSANPYIGTPNKAEEVRENSVQVIFPAYLEKKIVTALHAAHPYEEVAYYVYALENEQSNVGAGMVGELDEAMNTMDFLQLIKRQMTASSVRYTDILREKVKKIAVCGGAGSFLLPQAIASKADIFISADFKYHEFFDADKQIIIADIGHYESEQFTIDLLKDILEKENRDFEIFSTKIITNPINYL